MIHVAILSTALVLAMSQPAQAGVFLAAIGSLFTTGTTAGFFTTITGRLLIAIGSSLLLRAIQPRPEAPRDPGIRTQRTLSGSQNAQSFILGRYATGGSMVCPPMSHGNVGGTPNFYLTHVIQLSDVPGARLAGLIVNDEYVEIEEAEDENTPYGHRILGRYEGHAWIRYYDGTQTAADPMLLDKYADHELRPWSADMVGTGICYAILTFGYNREVWQGEPRTRFVLDGIPLYDPRLDTTVGGEGAHRWSDPSTWEHSDNPIVIAYNVARGIHMPGGVMWGGGYGVSALPLATWIAAMDASDDAVDIGDGATEPTFRAGLEVLLSDEPARVLEDLCIVSAAQMAEVGGAWKVRVGGPGLPVMAITDDDVIATAPESEVPFPVVADTFNAVNATYPDPGALWEPAPAPGLFDEELEAEDGGQQYVADLQLDACPYPLQAQRIMRAYLDEERRFRRHILTLPPEADVLEPLDAITWTSARNFYETKVFEVDQVVRDTRSRNVTVSLRERDAGDFNPPSEYRPVLPPGAGIVAPEAEAVPGFAASTAVMRDSDGNPRAPAIRLSWNAAAAADVVSLTWQIRPVGQATAQTGLAFVSEGAVVVSDGLVRAGAYQARARLLASRPTVWTNWLPVTSGDVPRIAPEDLVDSLREQVSTAFARTDAALSDATGTIGDLIAQIEGHFGEVLAPLPSEPLQATVVAEVERLDVAIEGIDGVLDTQIERVDLTVEQIRAAEIDLDAAFERLTALSGVTFTTEQRLADAGLYTDPDTGEVRIYAIESLTERASSAEIRLDAAEAQIELRATMVQVNQAVAAAVLDPTQLPVLDDLTAQINDVSITLDAETGRIDEIATALTVDGSYLSLTEVQSSIDALEGEIALRVTSGAFEDAEARLTEAEQSITALGDTAAIAQTVQTTRRLFDTVVDLTDRSIADLWEQYQEREAVREASATARQELLSTVDETFAAEAAARTQLAATVDANIAQLATEATVRADADSALAARATALELTVNDSETGLGATVSALDAVTGRVTTAEGDISAVAQRATDLEATVNDPEEGVTATATALGSLTTRVEQTEDGLSIEAAEKTVLVAQVRGLDREGDGIVEGAIVDLWERFASDAELRAGVSLVAAEQRATIEEFQEAAALDRVFLGSRIDTLDGQQSGTATALDQLTTRVTVTEDGLESVAKRTTLLESELIESSGGQTTLAQAVDQLDTRVTSAEGEITGLAQRATTLESGLTAAEGSISSNANATDALTTRVTAAEGEIDSVSQRATALESGLSSAEQGIATGALARDALTTRVTTAEGTITTLGQRTTDLEADLTTAEGAIAAQGTAANALSTRVTTAEGDIDSLSQSVTTLTSGLSNAQDGVDANAAAVGSLTTRVTSAEGTITSLGQRTTTLELDLASAETGIAGNALATDSLTTRVTTAEGGITTLGQRATTLEATVNDPGAGVAATASAVDQLDTRVTSAEGEITTLSQRTTALESGLTAAEGEIDANATAVGQLDTRVTNAEGTITSQGQAITGLTSDLSSAESDIAVNASAVSGLTTRVTSAEGSISSLAQNVTNLQTDLNDAESGIAANASGLSGLVTRVDATEDGITALSARSDVIEGALGSGNLVPNGRVDTGSFEGWGQVSAAFAVEPRAGSTPPRSTAPTPFVIRLNQDANAQSARASSAPVAEGDVLRPLLRAAVEDGGSATVGVRFNFLGADDSVISMVTRFATVTSSTWASLNFMPVTAPPGAANVVIRLERNGGGAGVAYATDLRVERDGVGLTDALARVSTIEGAYATEEEALAFVEQQISASYGSMTAMAEATAFAQAGVDGITSGYVFRLNGSNVLELVSVDDGTDGNALSTARIAADYVQITGLTQIDAAVIEDLAVSDAFVETLTVSQANIADGAITNAKIAGAIQSDNFVPGSTGWRLDKSGNAEFQNLIARGALVTGAISDVWTDGNFVNSAFQSNGSVLVSRAIGRAIDERTALSVVASMRAAGGKSGDYLIQLRVKASGSWSGWNTVSHPTSFTTDIPGSSASVTTRSVIVTGNFQDVEARVVVATGGAGTSEIAGADLLIKDIIE